MYQRCAFCCSLRHPCKDPIRIWCTDMEADPNLEPVEGLSLNGRRESENRLTNALNLPFKRLSRGWPGSDMVVQKQAIMLCSVKGVWLTTRSADVNTFSKKSSYSHGCYLGPDEVGCSWKKLGCQTKEYCYWREPLEAFSWWREFDWIWTDLSLGLSEKSGAPYKAVTLQSGCLPL